VKRGTLGPPRCRAPGRACWLRRGQSPYAETALRGTAWGRAVESCATAAKRRVDRGAAGAIMYPTKILRREEIPGSATGYGATAPGLGGVVPAGGLKDRRSPSTAQAPAWPRVKQRARGGAYT